MKLPRRQFLHLAGGDTGPDRAKAGGGPQHKRDGGRIGDVVVFAVAHGVVLIFVVERHEGEIVATMDHGTAQGWRRIVHLVRHTPSTVLKAHSSASSDFVPPMGKRT